MQLFTHVKMYILTKFGGIARPALPLLIRAAVRSPMILGKRVVPINPLTGIAFIFSALFVFAACEGID
jgi:hypothetical protein